MSGDSGARHDRVSIKDDTFFAMPINLPSEQEQSKIASFLQSLDDRIDAQEKLVASLKKYKRGLLNAFFAEKSDYFLFSDASALKIEEVCDVTEWKRIPKGETFCSRSSRNTVTSLYQIWARNMCVQIICSIFQSIQKSRFSL